MLLNQVFIRSSVVALTLAVAACGGGGSGGSDNNNSGGGTGGSNTWVMGEFTPYPQLANLCVANGTGVALDEKLWLRSYSNDTYLWYDEIPDVDPAPYGIVEYFDLLKTSALTPSGKLKDEFHFSMSTEEWNARSTSGASFGFGLNIAINQGAGIDRTITVTYTDPNTPATQQNIARGAMILTIDGVDVATANDQASIDTLNNGLFPDNEGQQTTFVIKDLGASENREVVMTAQTIVSDPVPLVSTFNANGSKVGYVVFNDHIATAEKGLFDAFNQLENEAIDELVIDLRYNGGGYLAIASELGYMVAGNQTNNKIFENTIFNDKYPSVNPITGRALSPTPFYRETVGLNTSYIGAGVDLPTLNLSRIFVLTSGGTCSASEAFINGLRGIDVDVIQIGTTTCGKPYGFYPADNCGTTYFTVQFKGENHQGFGDYADGFSPAMNPMLDTEISGCPVNDDLAHALGDTDEGMLSAAVYYLENGRCPELPAGIQKAPAYRDYLLDSEFKVEDTRPQGRFRSNRIMQNP